jgi:DNA-binding NarL/FixJ family response regulator
VGDLDLETRNIRISGAVRLPPVRVVLVDDHEVLRSGVRGFVDSLPGYEIVGEASAAHTALQMIESTKPDVVLMDIALPGMDGILATREILWRVPTTRVIVLSACQRIEDVRNAIEAGAIGYVLKADPPDTLADALEHATRGLLYVPPGLARGLPRDEVRLAVNQPAVPEIARKLCAARKAVKPRSNRVKRRVGPGSRESEPGRRRPRSRCG